MRKRFFLLWNILHLVICHLYAQNKTIVALQVDFIRTETQGDQSLRMTGSVSYEKNPFVFVFTTDAPVAQTAYLTQNGAFLRHDATDYAITDGADALLQTCTDFLNWFKTDFALTEAGFAPVSCALQDGKVVADWRYTKSDEHPIEQVLVTLNRSGQYQEMQMFGTDGALITRTVLSDYKKDGAYAYPTLIRSERFADGQPPVVTTLQFSQVRFNSLERSPYGNAPAAIPSAPVAKQVPASYRAAQHPAGQAYYVSLPSVLTFAGFSMYKACITSQDMSRCPYDPSCSQYMLQAVRAHGLVGLIEGLERKRRCTREEHNRGFYPDTADGKHYDPLPRSQGRGE